jgi:hypothetical protein
MDITNFKQYSVIVEGGSGVLFQPMTDEYFYILTAKHILQTKNQDGTYSEKEDNTAIKVIRFIFENSWSTEEIPFQLVKGKTYFPNSNNNIDVAILKIRFDEYKPFEINNLQISVNTIVNNDTYLCGFPNDKRKANAENLLEQYTNYTISQNSNDLDFKKSVRLLDHQTQETIVGMSGGGIIKLNDNYFKLIGIQSQMTKTVSDQNEIDFFPMTFFNEIVSENPEILAQLLPSNLTSFQILTKEILRLEEAIPELIPKLKSAFSEQLKNVTTNPLEICNKNILNKLLTKNTIDNNLNSKDFWIACLEYLLILSLLEDKIIDIDSLLELIDEKRFLHSDTDLSWIQILPEILNSDIQDLKEGSTLIVSTKKTPSAKRRLNTEYIRDIADPQSNFTIDRVNSIKKIKEIIHIKAFEIDCFINNEHLLNAFKPLQLVELIAELKKIVHEFFEN